MAIHDVASWNYCIMQVIYQYAHVCLTHTKGHTTAYIMPTIDIDLAQYVS